MPNWNSLESVSATYKVLSYIGLASGIIVALFGVIGSIAGVGSYFFSVRKDELSSARAQEELDAIKSTIHNLTAHILVDFSWPENSNPLIPADHGEILDSEIQMELSESFITDRVGDANLIFRRTALYEIEKYQNNSATFKASLFVRSSDYPIGSLKSSLKNLKYSRIILPVKGYWATGRDNYPINIKKLNIEFKVNGIKNNINLTDLGGITPVHLYSNVIWGYVLIYFNLPENTFQ